RNEEAGRTGGCIRLRAVQSVANRLCWIAFLTQKQVCPRVDKEIDALLACRSTNGCDPACLPVHWIEPGALDDAVFEIDPDHAEFEKARDVFGQRPRLSSGLHSTSTIVHPTEPRR